MRCMLLDRTTVVEWSGGAYIGDIQTFALGAWMGYICMVCLYEKSVKYLNETFGEIVFIEFKSNDLGSARKKRTKF